MPTSDNAKIEYEASQSLVAMVALTDSGDAQNFDSADELWSNKSGFAPVVRPDGVVTGFKITVDEANDKVNIAAGTLYQAGVLRSIGAAADEDIARPTLANIIYSITIDNAQAIDVVPGAEKAGSFDTARGEDGAPPFIPVGSVEIGLIYLNSSTPAVITASEIKQSAQAGTQERFDYPSFNQERVRVTAGIQGYAGVEFVSVLPLTHTAEIPKGVFAEYYIPEFAELPDSENFVPADTTHSVTSKQVYNNTLGSSSSTLTQSTFTFYPIDGITDAIFLQQDENLFFKFKQDRLNDPFILEQGKFGMATTFPAADLVQVSATVSTNVKAVRVQS